MKTFDRLRDGGATAIEAALLDSAALDVPMPDAKARALMALGVGGALAIKSGSAAAAASGATAWKASAVSAAKTGVVGAAFGTKSGTLLLVTQWVAAGMLAGGVTLGGAHYVQERTTLRTTTPPIARNSNVHPGLAAKVRDVNAEAVSTSEQAKTRAEGFAPSSDGTADQQDPSSDQREHLQTGQMRTAERARPSEPMLPAKSALAEEVAQLEAVTTLLSQGQAPQALRRLDDYEIRFRSPALLPEAQVLRVRALLAIGRIKEARRLGEQLLLRAPTGAHAQRVRSLLDQAGVETP
jgi:hypothetical protein